MLRLLILCTLLPAYALAVDATRYQLADSTVLIEPLRNDLLRVHVSAAPVDEIRPPTPMIAATDAELAFDAPQDLQRTDDALATGDLRIEIDREQSTLALFDADGRLLTRLRPRFDDGRVTLSIERAALEHAYGLGEHFFRPTSPDGDLVGRRIAPANPLGNAMEPYLGGYIGNDQIPICFFVGPEHRNFALLVDEFRPLDWNLQSQPWQVSMEGASLTFYVITGPNLPDLRRDTMTLTGRPPVPPKQAFGLWVSEYGYEDWAELDEALAGLQEAEFPLDGFVLDLQWFGDIEPGGDQSRMGRLAWDEENFPNAAAKIAALRRDYGVGIVPIEESYVTRTLPVYGQLAERNLLVRNSDGRPVDFERWWGAGGMLDWSNPATRQFWHDAKRRALLDAGVLGHWTDLGEPETYDKDGRYFGLPSLGWTTERDLHNAYNLLWAQGIWQGYETTHPDRRPWILSRSGTAGIQRFGVAQWSGDIASNLRSLAAHLNVQMHMAMSGVDYYGADIGGFNRWAVEADEGEMYSRWFAHGALLDVPVRPHTSNRENRYETGPDRIGNVTNNLANIRLRYRLLPYFYSLAHRAWRYGDPLVPPLVYAYQDDPEVRELGRHKLIGRDLLVACAPYAHQKTTEVYLPEGIWIDYHTGRWHESRGRWLQRVPVERDGQIVLPIFARGGAVLPEMHVDAQTMNSLGKRRDGSRRDELIVRVFPAGRSHFDLYEDDGVTRAYETGAVRVTTIRQETTAAGCVVTLGEPRGVFDGAIMERPIVLRIVAPPKQRIASVAHNGTALTALADDAFGRAAGFRPNGSITEIRTDVLPVAEEHRFEISWEAEE